MEHPISQRVWQEGHVSQRNFAETARSCIAAIENVSSEIADAGLIIRGLGELDLELAVLEIRRNFSDVHCGKPQVNCILGPPLLEPIYRITVDSPVECWGKVMSDMSSRRALIQQIHDSARGKRFVAEVPVGECFGYSTVLRGLTQGRGEYALEFSHYGKAWSGGAA